MSASRSSRRWPQRLLLSLLGLLVLIQLVPYGRAHDNPPVRREPSWDRPETREMAARACFDCHSNQVRWPWYSHVAPVSWLVQHDVDEAREHLNFSEWDRPQEDADEAAEEVAEGEMPLWYYTPVHPEARLSGAERRQLAAGLRATVGEGGEGEEDEDSDD